MVRKLGTKKLVAKTEEKVYKNDEQLLDEVVARYVKNKKQLDKLKKVCDEDNKIIKKVLLNKEEQEYSVGKNKVSVSSYEKISMDEELLVMTIKRLINQDNKNCLRKLIKQKEYVDELLLENAILENKLDAKEIADCQIVKTIVNLNIK